MNWEKLVSNLSFTVENKPGNLHGIKDAPILNTIIDQLQFYIQTQSTASLRSKLIS